MFYEIGFCIFNRYASKNSNKETNGNNHEEDSGTSNKGNAVYTLAQTNTNEVMDSMHMSNRPLSLNHRQILTKEKMYVNA